VITSIKDNLSEVDLHCHVLPRLKVYLNPSSSIIWGLNEVTVSSKLRRHLERQVYESCIKAKDTLLSAAIDHLNVNQGKGKPDSNEVANVSDTFAYFCFKLNQLKLLFNSLQFLTRLSAEGLSIPVEQVYITFLMKHVKKVNEQRCLRNTSDIVPFPISSGKNGGFTQQQLQSHLLIMSTPPMKEIMYPFSSAPDISSASLLSGQSMTGTVRPAFKGPCPQHLANFTDKPRGILVAHLHEHSSCITKICPLTAFKGLFATACRNDVRIWDAEKMEGKNVANRSRCHIRLPGEKHISNIAYAGGSNVIGVADDKMLYGFRYVSCIGNSVIL
jgi:hypothetical protein